MSEAGSLARIKKYTESNNIKLLAIEQKYYDENYSKTVDETSEEVAQETELKEKKKAKK